MPLLVRLGKILALIVAVCVVGESRLGAGLTTILVRELTKALDTVLVTD